MGAVHIRIRHDDNLVVAQLGEVELLPDAGAQSRDHRLKLVVAIDLVRSGLFHIQHLAPQGEDRLKPGVPPLGGGAAGGVTLDDIELGKLGVVLVAVPELIRHGGPAQGGFAPDGFPCLFGRLPGAAGGEGLVQNHPPHLGIFLQEGLQLFRDNRVHQRPDFAVAKLRLCLSLKLGVCQLHGDHAGEALPAVLAGDFVLVLEHLDFPAIGVQYIRQRALEALLMHAALRGMDVVGKGENGLVIAGVILHGHFRHGVLPLSGHVDDALMKRVLRAVQPGDKLPDAAGVAHGILLLLTGTQVHSPNPQPRV